METFWLIERSELLKRARILSWAGLTERCKTRWAVFIPKDGYPTRLSLVPDHSGGNERGLKRTAAGPGQNGMHYKFCQ